MDSPSIRRWGVAGARGFSSPSPVWDQETTCAAADLLAAWERQRGVPKALYCDWKNVYQRQPTSREVLQGIEPKTQFGRMCAKLGIRIIAASSPQAKGRVEHHHGTHQDP